MRFLIRFAVRVALLGLAFVAQAQEWKAPTAMKKLANGLVVVVSEDHSAPTFGLCLSYGIGFRLEPEGRTGFAHLFEHMMFEGTPVSPKGVFDRVIEGGGGFNNGDTRYDFTEYIESGPISVLEPMLWLEADRMKALDFSVKNLDNQRNVVEEEVRVNVLNQPYGSFYWLDLPQKAFDTYPNSHNFYGDFKDLDAANIEDVKKFYQQYYVPNNAVLAIVGDVNTADVFAKVEKYLASVPAGPPPKQADFSEPAQKSERRFTETDKLANVPALAIGYRMPPRTSPDAIVGAVTAELLHNGDASILYQALVKEKQVAASVGGGDNWPLGNAFEYNGPTLMTSFIVYPDKVSLNQVLSAYDATIAELAKKGPTREQVERIAAKMRSDWYDNLEIPINRASALSHAVLFEGSFDSVYEIPDRVAKVTPEQVKNFAAKYLVPSNRTIINRVPAPPDKTAATGGAQ
ncbi:MAG TPA: pitrilysin family protein [Terriglobales bacterium]